MNGYTTWCETCEATEGKDGLTNSDFDLNGRCQLVCPRCALRDAFPAL